MSPDGNHRIRHQQFCDAGAVLECIVSNGGYIISILILARNNHIAASAIIGGHNAVDDCEVAGGGDLGNQLYVFVIREPVPIVTAGNAITYILVLVIQVLWLHHSNQLRTCRYVECGYMIILKTKLNQLLIIAQINARQIAVWTINPR